MFFPSDSPVIPLPQSVPSVSQPVLSGSDCWVQGFQMGLQERRTQMVQNHSSLSPGPRGGSRPVPRLGCSDPEELPRACLPAGLSLSSLLCHSGGLGAWDRGYTRT